MSGERWTERLPDALAPVRDALHAAARDEAATMLAAAHGRATQAVAEAARQADSLLDEARSAGHADAEAVVAAERAGRRRDGQALVLRARRDAYERLRDDVRIAAARLPASPGYPALRSALVAAAQRQLGADAEIEDAAGGGIVARSGHRRLDLSLEALAADAADRVAAGLDLP